MSAPPNQKWMHAYTYSGHATCCAVALANLDIIERENLVSNAAAMGARVLAGVNKLAEEFDCIGDIRSLGLMTAVEFVADRETKASANMANDVLSACLDRNLLTRTKGESLILAPPLTITPAEVDEMLAMVRGAITATL
jgi:adenosylmethionine-8-amino-7-oxononanoate aminotransferase